MLQTLSSSHTMRTTQQINSERSPRTSQVAGSRRALSVAFHLVKEIGGEARRRPSALIHGGASTGLEAEDAVLASSA